MMRELDHAAPTMQAAVARAPKKMALYQRAKDFPLGRLGGI